MKIIEPEQANCNTTNNQTQTASWRQRLRIHPAAELFPLDSDDIRVLADDIRQYGLREPVSVIKDGNGYVLLDGRNRLDAMEMAGKKIDINDRGTFEHLSASIDVNAFVISKNIHHRHLTAKQKRELIGKLLKANPEKSDRQIAKQAKASPTTVGMVRAEIASTVQPGQLPEKRVGMDGKTRKQPAKKQRKAQQNQSSRDYHANVENIEELEGASEEAPWEDNPDAQEMQRRRGIFLRNASAALAYGLAYTGPIDDHDRRS
jgi:ParB-like chromosome segregation protein Spo0J